MLYRSTDPTFITGETPVSLYDMLFKFSLDGCMAREYFPRKRNPYKLVDFSLTACLVIFITFHWNLVSYKEECLSPFPCHLTHFIFPLISEAVTLCTVFWVLMLIEVVPERLCTWHVKEWVTGSRYKYF